MDATKGRQLRERDFHNAVYGDPHYANRCRRLFYSVASSIERRYTDTLLARSRGKRVLEYGCGLGARALVLAREGARVSAIDISDAAISRAAAEARAAEIPVEFFVMDAEELQFDDNEFDVVCGAGILHHLDLRKALAEVRRVLKPDGFALFVEPLAHNPLLRAFRALTPSMRTPDERPLTAADLTLLESGFRSTSLHFYYLTSMLAIAVPFLGLRLRTAGFLERVDRSIFERLPRLRFYAWQVLMELCSPLK